MLAMIIGRAINIDLEQKMTDFHFHGCFLGYRINKVSLTSYSDHLLFSLGEEYCIILNAGRVQNGILFGVVEKFKKIDEMSGYI